MVAEKQLSQPRSLYGCPKTAANYKNGISRLSVLAYFYTKGKVSHITCCP